MKMRQVVRWKLKAKSDARTLKYVWLIENGSPVSYLATQVTVKFISVWFICKTVKSKVARVVALDKVFLSKKLALRSLVKFDCWYIEDERILPANGYRRGDGSIVAFDKKSECELRYTHAFTTRRKAERSLLHDLCSEKRRINMRIAEINRVALRIAEINRATLRLQKNHVSHSR